ncbi:MAG: hypothetical protein E4H36_04415 [Spirochaetales bacterium]|nr:MAG: hypothetical protein E4H36_04415 [Spirochaetales bacterium]
MISELEKRENPAAGLASLRNPASTDLSREFERYRHRLFKGTGILLSAPENFEGSSFRVEFSFSSKEQLAAAVLKLREAGDYADELFSILQ